MTWFDKLLSGIFSVYVPLAFTDPGTFKAGDSFYEKTADIYSSLFSSEKTDDISMYLSFARSHGSLILEAACGDGRILIPLAKNGFTVYGFDSSVNLLSICRSRITKLQQEVRSRISLSRASLQSIPFRNTFTLALIPYNSFNHLIAQEDQRLCLNGIYNVLCRGGILVMEILPFHEYYFTGIRARKTGFLLDKKSKITAYSRVVQDIQEKCHTVYWYITVSSPEKPVKRITCHFTRKDITLSEMEQLLKGAGFTIEEIRQKYTEDDRYLNKRIIVAKKP